MPLTPGRFVGQTLDLRATSSQRGMVGTTVAGVGGTGFTPLHLRGLALWLDAADTDTITSSSGTVSQWNDKSGFGRHVSQATSSAQPGTGAQTQNGLNVLTFDGGDWLKVTSDTLAQPYTLVCLGWLRSGASTTATRLIGNATSGAVQLLDGVALSVSTAFYAGTDFVTAGSSTTREVWRIHFGVARGANSYAVSSGARGAIGNAGANTFQLATIGARGDNTVNLDGRIAEVVICARELTDGERIALERYLTAKWAL